MAQNKTILPKKESKKDVAREETKCKLRAAALNLFSKMGFEGVSTKEIAIQAKVNESLIFRYFKDKRGLLLAIVAEKMKEMDEVTRNYPAGQSIGQEIRNFLLHQHHQDRQQVDFLRVSIATILTDKKLRKELARHVPIYGSPILTARLKSLNIASKYDNVDMELISSQVSLIACGLMMMTTLGDYRGGEQLIDQFAKSLDPSTT